MGAVEKLESHPAAELFPLLSGKEYESFKADIAERGLLEAIWLCDDKILDGRNRYRACVDLGIEPKFRTYEGDSPVAFAWSLNGQRRHLSRSQLMAVGVKMLPALEEEAKKRVGGRPSKEQEKPGADMQQVSKGRAAEQAAALTGVSPRGVYKAKEVLEKDPELFKRIESGEITVNAASEQISKKKGPRDNKLSKSSEARAERIERTRQLAHEGHRVSQIAAELGVGEEVVKRYAKAGNITLPDTAIGNSRKIDARRVIEKTVYGLSGYAQGLRLINGNIPDIGTDTASEWADSIKESITPIQLLRRKLLRIANGN